jgi:hypothetical protein
MPAINFPSLSAACFDVLAARINRIRQHGIEPSDDDTHADNELLLAGISYAQHAAGELGLGRYRHELPLDWPWPETSWNPIDARDAIVLAAVYLIAELERLDRLQLEKRP